jgi:hypothetical protein
MPRPYERGIHEQSTGPDFLQERRELVIGEEGDPDPLTIVYRPGMFNAEYQKAIRKLSETDDGDHKVAVYTVCMAVSEWDLKGPISIEEPVLDRKGKPITDDYGIPETEHRELVGDGKPVPLTSSIVRYLPTPMLIYIMQAIGEDMRPDPKSTTTS